MNVDVKRLWMEAVVTCFQILAENFHGGIEANCKKSLSKEPVFQVGFEDGHPECKSGMLTNTQCCLVL